MTRAELLARMSSRELSGWLALFQVQADEAAYARMVAESSDGQVVIQGRDDDEDDEDGETE